MLRYHPVIKNTMIVALILIAVGAIFYEPFKSLLVTSKPPKVSRRLARQNLYRPADYNWNHVEPVTMRQVLHARLHEGDIHTVGQIAAPADGLHLPIGLGVGKDTLMLAAGTMRPGERMGQGNYALAGHHMVNPRALFTPLYLHAKPGQMVYLTDRNNVYQYEIKVRKTISMHDMGVINDERTPEITLITCASDQYSNRRLLIGGTLVKTYPLSNAPTSLKKYFTKRTNNYQVLKGY